MSAMPGDYAESPIKQSVRAAYAHDNPNPCGAFATKQLDTVRPMTLLDKAQAMRQTLLRATTTLATVLGDADAEGDERELDKPHDTLTQEIELAAMLAQGLVKRTEDLERMVGKL